MKLRWYGPTMGKTTSALINKNIIDFDEVSREPFEKLAHELGMTVRQMKKEMPQEFHELFLKLLDELENIDEDKYVLVSNAIGLHYHYRFEVILIPSIDEFIKRTVNRGGNAADAWDLYQDLMHVHGGSKRCVIENRFVNSLI